MKKIKATVLRIEKPAIYSVNPLQETIHTVYLMLETGEQISFRTKATHLQIGQELFVEKEMISQIQKSDLNATS